MELTVPLTLQHRRVGDITVVKCRGRIVEGSECAAFRQRLDDLLEEGPDIVLDVADLEFMDSSGVGTLVRMYMVAQRKGGDLKLCAPRATFRELLRITRLGQTFDTYESESDAIAAFYQGLKAAGTPRATSDVLCVAQSADVLAFVREVLRQAGYGVVGTDNVPDALTLLRATRPKVIVRGADLHPSSGSSAADAFNRHAAALPIVDLPEHFSHDEAGDAARQLLDKIREIAE